MPPPNETTILTNVLLAPAPLPTIIPPARFTALFPAPARANPQIDVLYRELQHQRALLMDRVAAHIVAESDRGAAQRRDMARTWRDVGRNWVGETEGWGMREVGMEEVYVGAAHGASLTDGLVHTMKSLVAEMEAACKEIAAALAQLGVDMDAMYKDLKDTVVDLDTLRYRSLLASADGNVDILNDVWDGMDKMIEGLGMMLEGRWEVNRERRRVQAQPERQAYEHQWHDLNAAIRDGDEFHLRPGQL